MSSFLPGGLQSRSLARALIAVLAGSWLLTGGLCAACVRVGRPDGGCCHGQAALQARLEGAAWPCCAGAPPLPSEPVRFSSSTVAAPLALSPLARALAPLKLEPTPVVPPGRRVDGGLPLYLLLRTLLI